MSALEKAESVCREFPRLSNALETLADIGEDEPGGTERLSALYNTTGLDLVMEALMAMDWRISEATGSEAHPRFADISHAALRKQWTEVQGEAEAVEDVDQRLKSRVPAVVLEKVSETAAEALEVAERVRRFVWEMDRLGDTLSVLSDDETLPIATTTHDPQAERLDALREASGYTMVEKVESLMLTVLHDRSTNPSALLDLRDALRRA